MKRVLIGFTVAIALASCRVTVTIDAPPDASFVHDAGYPVPDADPDASFVHDAGYPVPDADPDAG